MKTLALKCGYVSDFDPEGDDYEFDVPDSLSEVVFKNYLDSLDGKNQLMGCHHLQLLFELLLESEAKGHDINRMVEFATLSSNRQVVFEHHLLVNQ